MKVGVSPQAAPMSDEGAGDCINFYRAPASCKLWNTTYTALIDSKWQYLELLNVGPNCDMDMYIIHV